jgi:hypothetical protein
LVGTEMELVDVLGVGLSLMTYCAVTSP